MEFQLGRNIRYLRKQKGYTIAAMADLMGVGDGQLNMWELGNSYPKFLDFLKISEFFGVSETELVHTDLAEGQDSAKISPSKKTPFFPEKGQDSGQDKGQDSPSKPAENSKTERIKELQALADHVMEKFGKTGGYNVYDFDGHAAAGHAIALLEEDKKRRPPNMFLPGLGPGLHIRVQAQGESMFPSIKPGDKAVSTWVSDIKEVHSGAVYLVIDANDGAVYKRLYREGKNHFRFESDNENFKPYTRHLEDILAVFRVREVHSTDLRPYWADIRRDVAQLKAEMEGIRRVLRDK